MSEKFNRMVHSFHQVKPDDVVSFEFEFNGTEDEIEYIQRGCGCTEAYYDSFSNSIKGTLDLSQIQEYTEPETPVTKYITVFYNDGQPHYIADSQKRIQDNNKKKRDRLQLHAIVIR